MATTNDEVYSLAQELITTVNKQRVINERLLALCIAERQAIVANHLDELASTVEEKELLINRQGQLEQWKQQTRGSLAKALGCDSLGPRYEHLLPILPSEHREELNRAENERIATTMQLAESNNANATLIKDLLNLSQELLHCILNLGNRGCSYSALGQLQPFLATALTSVNRRV